MTTTITRSIDEANVIDPEYVGECEEEARHISGLIENIRDIYDGNGMFTDHDAARVVVAVLIRKFKLEI